MNDSVRLQVLVSTYGPEAMRAWSEASHPKVAGVEYLVCWQQPDSDAPVPVNVAGREDMRVFVHHTRGLSKNRNHALERASAPLLLIADDDVTYTGAGLQSVIGSFDENPEAAILTFNFAPTGEKKPGANFRFDLRKAPRGHYVSSIEIAMRREVKDSGLRFDENFGVNGKWVCGEEQLFLHQAIKCGWQAQHLPLTICRHDSPTTTVTADARAITEAKGALFRRMHPTSWPLHLLAHILRAPVGHRLTYLRSWLRGAFPSHV